MDWSSAAASKTANTIRIIAAEAVEKANSGHPGMPMGSADMALVLWAKYLNFNPQDPRWPNRDRFILSAGHGSMLLYALLHLFGYDLPMEEIKNFRQWESKTPGHPEYGVTPGVETTAGPLGQGFSTGVGMALANKLMAARINTPKFPVLGHKILGIVSDGDLMEGVTAEAASLAGHLGLGNLAYLYDDNEISIEGPIDLAFSDDTAKRFEAYHWNVIKVNGHDRAAVDDALFRAVHDNGKPTLIMARTRIGFGCPTKVGSADTHGAPLGGEELMGARECLGVTDPEFYVSPEVYEFCKQALEPKVKAYDKWREMISAFRAEEPERAKIFDALLEGAVPEDLEARLLAAMDDKPMATRKASGACLQVLSALLPNLYGGSADLAPSNNTLIKGALSVSRANFEGKNLRFGIREHAMGAMANGMALYGLIPYVGTFMVFCDYMRPPIRLAAMMGLRVIYVFTHDSMFVGEDGPTHQPIEQLAALRLIPGLHVFRPADAAETAIAWSEALNRKDGPTVLALTRQDLPPIDRARFGSVQGAKRGGYVLAAAADPDLVLMASGSEVALAMEAYEELTAQGKKVHLVSMPCLEVFDQQEQEYQNEVLVPSCLRRVAIEAGRGLPWYRYIGISGFILSMERFGASAPYKRLAYEFGFNKEAVLEMIKVTFPEIF